MTARGQKGQVPVKLGNEIVKEIYGFIENDRIEAIGFA
jgi:hypothetical protein